MDLEDLEVYRLACKISDEAWGIYDKFSWQNKKIIGDQFVRSADSVAANIAEGFGRFHYLDKNKFNYNARGSLFEARHWAAQLSKRNLVAKEQFDFLDGKFNNLAVKLNNFIASARRQGSK
jgi:four helix bundle protein